jgi:hypothetical protein
MFFNQLLQIECIICYCSQIQSPNHDNSMIYFIFFTSDGRKIGHVFRNLFNKTINDILEESILSLLNSSSLSS